MDVKLRYPFGDIGSFDQEDDSPRTSEPLSPAGGAESLFLAGLTTSQLSKDALSNTLHLAHRFPPSVRSISAASVRSAMTDDFHSCADFSTDDNLLFLDPSLDDAEEEDNDDDDDLDDDNTAFFSFFTSRNRQQQARSVMTSGSNRRKKTRGGAIMEPTATSPTALGHIIVPEEADPDMAGKVYEKAKDVWAWGKTVPLVSIGLGISEAVAQKAASMAGTNLEKLDRDFIKPQLVTLDAEFLAPVVKAVVEYAKPIVIKFLSPFGLIKNEAENPELTTM